MTRAEISRVDDVEVAKSVGSTRSEDHEQSREDASQKPYSPSPGAGSRRRRVPKTCSPDRRCTSAVGTKGTKRRLSYEERRKRNCDDLEARRGAGFWRTIHAHVVRPRPSPRPGEARRASARACGSPHSLLSSMTW
jgi:hypothetical protein